MLNLEGRELGGCKLLRKLGAGGMGEVYLAEQRRVGNRLVAIKAVSPEDMTFHPEVVVDMTRRFEREVRLLGTLSHPNILPIYDSGAEGSLLYIVMEYAQEGSLADAMRGTTRQKLALPAAVPQAVTMVEQIAAALQFCHERDVVHRDVKPGNVLIRIEPDGAWHMLLADFGVARGLENTSQRTQVTGTFAYMAPEQFSGQFSPKSDQYALAVMAFQLLGGRLPFEGDLASLTRAHMYDPPPSLHAANPAVPQAVDTVIARALAKRPEDRYSSVAEFAAALKLAAEQREPADQSTQVATPVPVPPPPLVAPAPTLAQAGPSQPTASAQARPTRARGRVRPLRVLVTALVAVALLAGVYGGTQLLQTRQQANGTPTQTSQAGGTATSTGGSPSVSPGGTVSACGTLAGPAGCVVPTPPGFSGTVVLSDAAPTCGGNQYAWNNSVGVTTTCTSSGVTLKNGKTSSLGCLEAQAPGSITADGYAAFVVTPQSQYVALAFRQNTSSNGQITGYYFALFPDPSTNAYTHYEVYSVDATGKVNHLTQQALLSPAPGATFTLGVQYAGSAITVYVNGQQVGITTDATYTQGEFGMCTQGTATFRDASVYRANG